MMKKEKLTILIVAFLAILPLKAQENLLYYTPAIHQANLVNPALQYQCNTFLGFPAINAIEVDALFSGFSFNDALKKGVGIASDSLFIDLDNIEQRLGEHNYIKTEVSINLFALGFWIKDYYFTFHTNLKTQVRFGYPNDVLQIRNGNAAFMDEPFDLDLDFFGIAYTEYAFGLSHKVTDRLTIGGKFKLLQGLGNLNSRKGNITLETDPNSYKMTIKSDIEINATAPVEFVYDANGMIEDVTFDLFDDFDVGKIFEEVGEILDEVGGNRGIGIDLGANYQLTDDIQLSASVIDLGFISWKNNTHNLIANGEFVFDGIDTDLLLNDDPDAMSNFTDDLTDSIMKLFAPTNSEEAYKTYLNTQIYIGANYAFTKSLNFGLLSKTYFYDRRAHQAFTLSANLQAGKNFTTGLAYTIENRAYNNLGFALAMKMGALQFYFLTDNLNSIISPKTAKTVNMRLGFNLYFGCKKRLDVPVTEY